MHINQERQRLEKVADAGSQDALHDINDAELLWWYEITRLKRAGEVRIQLEDQVGAQEKLWDG